MWKESTFPAVTAGPWSFTDEGEIPALTWKGTSWSSSTRKNRDGERHRGVQGETETHGSQEDATEAWAVQGRIRQGRQKKSLCIPGGDEIHELKKMWL